MDDGWAAAAKCSSRSNRHGHGVLAAADAKPRITTPDPVAPSSQRGGAVAGAVAGHPCSAAVGGVPTKLAATPANGPGRVKDGVRSNLNLVAVHHVCLVRPVSSGPEEAQCCRQLKT
jgi:hypothetical protein